MLPVIGMEEIVEESIFDQENTKKYIMSRRISVPANYSLDPVRGCPRLNIKSNH